VLAMEARRAGASSKPRRAPKVKVVDLYQFEVEVTREEAAVLNVVKERVWWATEASKGAGWYLQRDMSSLTESNLVSHLHLSNFTDTGHLKKLIRKGIPPTLRGKVWRAVSGAVKKRSTVPDSYYQDLTAAVQGKETQATRQIDHVCPAILFFSVPFSTNFHDGVSFEIGILISDLLQAGFMTGSGSHISWSSSR
jgi:hypothetical protein